MKIIKVIIHIEMRNLEDLILSMTAKLRHRNLQSKDLILSKDRKLISNLKLHDSIIR